MDADAPRATLQALGLPALVVVADPAEVAALEGSAGCAVPFVTALRLAIDAFLTDETGGPAGPPATAVARVRGQPEAAGLGPDPPAAAIAAALRATLADDPAAEIVLLTPTMLGQDRYRFPPEYGERVSDNWVFRIIAPHRWGVLQWAIVDKTGRVPAYSYAFD